MHLTLSSEVATCSDVLPKLFLLSISAPLSIRASIHLTWPSEVAKCSDVLPLLSNILAPST